MQWIPPTVGAGQAYMTGKRDSEGRLFYVDPEPPAGAEKNWMRTVAPDG